MASRHEPKAARQVDLFSEGGRPLPMPGHYLTTTGSLGTVIRLPYRPELIAAVMDELQAGPRSYRQLYDALKSGETDGDALSRHLINMREEGQILVTRRYFGSESPRDGKYLGFENIYALPDAEKTDAR